MGVRGFIKRIATAAAAVNPAVKTSSPKRIQIHARRTP